MRLSRVLVAFSLSICQPSLPIQRLSAFAGPIRVDRELTEDTSTVEPGAASASWTVQGDQAGAVLGWSVASAGDVNGDGYDDVIVGAPGFDNGQEDEGKVLVYLGSPSGPSPEPSWSAEGGQDFAQFGWSVAAAGDVNGDGFDDVIVGANLHDSGQVNEGRAYVWLGGRSGLRKGGKPPSADWRAESDQPGAQFGHCVASAGDVNADGYDDVLVGSWLHDGSQVDAGAVFVYFGSPSGPRATPAWTLRGTQASAYLGFSVAGAGDVNADGYDDIVVGSPFHDLWHADEGLALLYLGGASGPAGSAAWSASGGGPLAQLGYSVSGAGDLNGDGMADVILGARGYSGGEVLEGRAVVHLGRLDGLDPAPVWAAESGQAYALLGYAVSGAGDVDGDGFDDVIVGADGYSGDLLSEGRAYVFLGSAAGPAVEPAWTVEGDAERAFLGRSVRGAGDVNADGLADVIVGSDGIGYQMPNAGRAQLFTGPL